VSKPKYRIAGRAPDIETALLLNGCWHYRKLIEPTGLKRGTPGAIGSYSSTVHKVTSMKFLVRSICLFLVNALAQGPVKVLEVGQDHFEADFPSDGQIRMHIRPGAIKITGSDEKRRFRSTIAGRMLTSART